MSWRSKDLKTLQREWRQKLSDSGFVDQEDERGRLKQQDRRTAAFSSREEVSEFYRRLDHYLADNPPLSEVHLQILQLYSEGRPGPEIVRRVGRCRRQVQAVFYAAKRRILA